MNSHLTTFRTRQMIGKVPMPVIVLHSMTNINYFLA